MKHYLVKDHFFKDAIKLRKTFEDKFKNPRETNSDRFVWDYWHVPNQYTLVRTPAYHYFPEKIFTNFHNFLVRWGQENLGCHNISPPWLSYYVDGCKQELHSDVPHGPWAFVFSLTPKKKVFKGGETLILKPSVLDYWHNFLDESDREQNSFVEKIPSPFNRLTVFDPRFPHAVTEVKGTQDPLRARLVIHGWFVEPRPYVVGPLSVIKVQTIIEEAIFNLQKNLVHVGNIHGTISLQLNITNAGNVSSLKILTNTVIGIDEHQKQRKILFNLINQIFSDLKFSKASKPSKIVIPILFK